MGLLIYANESPGLQLDDRVLAHLKVVVFAKLRRGESFGLSWNLGVELGSHRVSIWLHPAIPLKFIFHGSKPPSLNRTWIEQMAISANSVAGLTIATEPEDSWNPNDVATAPMVLTVP